MKHKKRKFKSIVINFKKIKSFLFIMLILIVYAFVVLSTNISDISTDFLKYCIESNFVFNYNKDAIFDFNIDNKALIKTALSYIEIKDDLIKTTKNEWINTNIDFKNNETDEPQVEKASIVSSNISIKNETKYEIDVEKMMLVKPHFDLKKDKPCVLIVHTHTSESYTSNGEFETMDTDRTLDSKYNMIRIGEVFEKVLTDNNINVIHDKTIHDYPSYTSSYKRTLETIDKYTKKYPSIQIVLDLHRDALIKEDGTKIKLSTNINGQDAAQVMIVCGTDASGLEFDKWKENLKFALQIQKSLETDYPTLSRPLLLSENRYNMHKTKGSLLFEIGTNGNTIYEAINGANLMAKSLSKTILELSK